ncbi:MAG: M67 family metallopeptidase [Candidatus Limnocylindrales bacterium]
MNADPEPRVRLPRAMAEAIARHAREARPNESCGLVVGSALASDGGEALRYVRCRNTATSPSRYVVHRDDLLAVLAELDRSGEELWGVVHSHVRSAAMPSTTDIGEAAWPSAVYLLVSLADDRDDRDDRTLESVLPDVRAWRIAGGAARELALDIRDGIGDDIGDGVREAVR